MNKQILSQKYLIECFNYDYESGQLIWKERPLNHFKDKRAMKIWNTRYSKKIAGIQINNGSGNIYLKITINYIQTSAHIIAWILIYGEYPTVIDHLDGNGINNRENNLSNGSQLDNCKNTRLRRNNTSGLPGVSKCTKCKSDIWIVKIGSDSANCLGRYRDFFEACCIRKSAEYKQGYSKNHGKPIKD